MPNRHRFDPGCNCDSCNAIKAQSWVVTAMFAAMVLVPAIGAFFR